MSVICFTVCICGYLHKYTLSGHIVWQNIPSHAKGALLDWGLVTVVAIHRNKLDVLYFSHHFLSILETDPRRSAVSEIIWHQQSVVFIFSLYSDWSPYDQAPFGGGLKCGSNLISKMRLDAHIGCESVFWLTTQQQCQIQINGSTSRGWDSCCYEQSSMKDNTENISLWIDAEINSLLSFWGSFL